jgi:hypothetical protein
MASRYWVGGGSTTAWTATANTNWAATSGGANNASVPTTADDVFLDANSGSGTISFTVNGDCKNLDTTGWTGAFSTAFNLNFSGNVNLGANVTNIALAAKGAVTHTFTSNGFSIRALTYSGAGSTISLQDDLVTTGIATGAGGIALNSSGTIVFTTNDHNITTAGVVQNIAGATSNWGSSVVTINGTSQCWSATAGTVNAGTSTIKFTDTSNTAVTFAGNGATYNNVWFNRGGSTANITVSGSNTFADFKDTGTAAHSILFTAGTTQTFSTFTVSGTVGNLIKINSTTTGIHTLSKSSGTVASDYLDIQHSVASGGASWYAGNHSTNNQGVATTGSGWVFTGAPFTNPGNIYASDNTYATVAATSGVLTVEVSKDAGSNWQTAETVTFTASDSLQTCGTGSTELWGTSWTRADMVDANFRVRLSHGNFSQIYKTFGFVTGSDTLTGVEVAIEGNYNSPTMSLDLLEVKIYYGTSVLPVQAGSQVYASNGRKVGEGAGSGTGTLVYYDGTAWRRVGDDTTVAA